MHWGCWTFDRYLNILGLQKTSIFFCKVETQILLKISFGELPGYPGMNIHSCPLLLWHSQVLSPRSLLAVLPPPTSTEKTTQGPKPTLLAVLPTPPPPTTQGPRLPGGKDARSSRCCHHHHHPPREKKPPKERQGRVHITLGLS